MVKVAKDISVEVQTQEVLGLVSHSSAQTTKHVFITFINNISVFAFICIHTFVFL